MENKINKVLTEKERAVLLEIAKLNGPQWKTLLADAWKNRRYFDLKGVTLKNCRHLHQLRYDKGPAWLKNFDTKELEKATEAAHAIRFKRKPLLRELVAEMAGVLHDLIRLEDLRLAEGEKDLENYRDQWNMILENARRIVSRTPGEITSQKGKVRNTE